MVDIDCRAEMARPPALDTVNSPRGPDPVASFVEDVLAGVDLLPKMLGDRFRDFGCARVKADEEPVRVMTALMLETLGYRVLQAANGEEALLLADRL